MNEDEKKLLISTSERSKSNTHQIEEIKADLKEVKEDQKAIYELTTSVKIIAENVSNMKDDLKEVKQGQINLSGKLDTQIQDVNNKVNELKFEPLEEMKKDKHELRIEVLKQGIGYLVALIGGAIIALISNGNLKV